MRRSAWAMPGDPTAAALTCTECGRVFPIRDGIPVLLLDEATGGPAVGAFGVTGPPVVDLHDGATLVAADAAALLPSAALAGAQVRSTAEQLAGRPAFDRPRAFVVIGGTAAVDAALLAALLGDQSPAPVVPATMLPGWVGPLDIVVVFAGAVDDMAAAEAAAQAQRRGARVVVRAAAEGPVAAAAGAALLEPQVSVAEALAGAGPADRADRGRRRRRAVPRARLRAPPPTSSTRWRWPATRPRSSS